MPNNRIEATRESYDLTQFEQVPNWSQKLVTASDKNAEFAYHAERLNQLTRLTVGDGIVCGIRATLSDHSDELRVTLHPGLAIDDAGNQLVVVEDETIRHLAQPDEDDLYLYLRYAECSKDLTPVGRNQNACKTECLPSRILETFEVFYKEASEEGAEPGRQSMPILTFPTVNEMGDAGDIEDDALFTMAEEYFEERLTTCESGADPVVFVGHFTRNSSGWKQEDDRLPYVFTNEMIHAITARHATDFTNPHDSTLVVSERLDENGEVLPGAAVEVEGDAHTDSAATLLSSDETVSVSPSDDVPKGIDLTVDFPEPTTEILDHYLRNRSLWCGCAFRRADRELGLSENFQVLTAREIAERLDEAVANDVADDPTEYVNLFRETDDGIVALERRFADELESEEFGDIEGTEPFRTAVDALAELIPEEDPENPAETAREIAMAHERLCTTLPCLHVKRAESIAPRRTCFKFERFDVGESLDRQFEYPVPDTDPEKVLTFLRVDGEGPFEDLDDVNDDGIADLPIPRSRPGMEIRGFDTSYVEITISGVEGDRIEVAAYSEDVQVAYDRVPESPDFRTEYKLVLDPRFDEIDYVEVSAREGQGNIIEICMA